jgi:hypothetical protein
MFHVLEKKDGEFYAISTDDPALDQHVQHVHSRCSGRDIIAGLALEIHNSTSSTDRGRECGN